MTRDLLLDVGRLLWRRRGDRLPTGIDRVCLAYVEHFGARAQAVVQRGGWAKILSPGLSDALFEQLGQADAGRPTSLLPRALLEATTRRERPAGRAYLNVGHTGLDHPGTRGWLAKADLRPIYMVHDLIPLTHPEYCRAGEADKHRRRMHTILETGHGVIGNSRATLAGLSAFAVVEGLAMPPSIAAWLGTTPLAAGTPAPATSPYFVMLGTIEARKNHAFLLQLWRRLVERLGRAAPRLVIIGQRGWENDQATALLDRTSGLAGVVEERSSCSDAELADCLAGARALLFPSFVEGYGMPLAEALGAGVPVIASDLAVFREIAGAIPDYAEPIDGTRWTWLIEDYARADSLTRAAQLSRLGGYAAPTWDSHCTRVDRWMRSLIHG